MSYYEDIALALIAANYPGTKGETGMSETNMSIGEFLGKITMRPVVLCRDCEYAYDDVSGLSCSHGVCVDCIVREDFFCADGKVAYKEEWA